MAGGVAAALAVTAFVVVNVGTGAAEPTHTYEYNEMGQTFGSAAKALSPDQEPDLISAMATNGRTGYLSKADYDAAVGRNVASPEEALAWQRAHEGTDISLTVYLQDGVTPIGEFVIHCPSAEEREAWAAAAEARYGGGEH